MVGAEVKELLDDAALPAAVREVLEAGRRVLAQRLADEAAAAARAKAAADAAWERAVTPVKAAVLAVTPEPLAGYVDWREGEYRDDRYEDVNVRPGGYYAAYLRVPGCDPVALRLERDRASGPGWVVAAVTVGDGSRSHPTVPEAVAAARAAWVERTKRERDIPF